MLLLILTKRPTRQKRSKNNKLATAWQDRSRGGRVIDPPLHAINGGASMTTKKHFSAIALKEAITGYVFIAPAVILFLVISLFTVLFSIWLSFYHLGQGQLVSSARFAGLNN